jgi:fructose-1,6-bisphosphatase I
MRWLAAAVGELHRILLVGGCFLYPADRRRGFENGRLRLIYEAVPIAFLIEQASGKATNGRSAILDLVPRNLHENTPLIFGAADEVDRVHRYLSQPF